MAVAVVTDSSHYLPGEVAAAYGLQAVSLYVTIGDTLARESDMPDLQDFYEHLRSASDLPTTSQPSIGDFLAVYEPLLAEGREIVSIHLSGALSGTMASAAQAKEQLAGSGGERIHVLDSRSACGGEGLVVLAAQAAAGHGADAAEVVAHAQAARESLMMWFAIDTLEFLRRGGRIGAAQAWLGTALRIKPILTLEEQITPVERVRTAGRTFERMVDYLRSRHDDGADAWVIQHIQAHAEADRLIERGREIFGSDPCFVSEVGPVIGKIGARRRANLGVDGRAADRETKETGQ
jgi:DegV family protein with EDD domain